MWAGGITLPIWHVQVPYVYRYNHNLVWDNGVFGILTCLYVLGAY